MKFNKFGTIRFPTYIHLVSIYIGKLRDLYNVELNEKNDKFKRGEQSEFVNILGIKGELIVQEFLFQNNVPYTSGVLLSDKPQGSSDVNIGKEFRIDVKAIRPESPDLLVNKEAHEKNKNITHYWFVQPLVDELHKDRPLNTANYWIFTKEEVDNWDVKNVKFSDAYYKEIKTIINEK
jgi:hypothetical protein